MQLFSKTQTGTITHAREALKGVSYQCLECNGVVRKRGGTKRQPHFYHPKAPPLCRQSGKSELHLFIQEKIFETLLQGEVQMEWRHEEIGRIADLVWHPNKIIFEIQCSPISAEEVLGRNRDWKSAGYQVVWIFDQRRFNRRWRKEAEEALASSPHYYTNLSLDGSGSIYDRFLSYPINLLRPIPIDPLEGDLPSLIKTRIDSWPIGFEGDLYDRYRTMPHSIILSDDKRESGLLSSLLKWYERTLESALFYLSGREPQ